MEEFKPGVVISPQTGPTSTPAPAPLPPATPQPARPIPDEPVIQPVPAPVPPAEPQAAPAPVAPETPTTPWQFTATDTPVPSPDEWMAQANPVNPVGAQPEEISWSAAEFVTHQKTAGWYGLLAVAGVVGASAIYLLTKDKISTGIVIFADLAMGVFAARKPRLQEYHLTVHGIQVGERVYGFDAFKSFSIVEEGGNINIVFMPLTRFMPPLSIYVAPDVEDAVVDFLSSLLPFDHRRQDAFDSLLRRIRF